MRTKDNTAIKWNDISQLMNGKVSQSISELINLISLLFRLLPLTQTVQGCWCWCWIVAEPREKHKRYDTGIVKWEISTRTTSLLHWAFNWTSTNHPRSVCGTTDCLATRILVKVVMTGDDYGGDNGTRRIHSPPFPWMAMKKTSSQEGRRKLHWHYNNGTSFVIVSDITWWLSTWPGWRLSSGWVA